MQTTKFRHHSAGVTCAKLESGVVEASFSGLITRNGLDALQASACAMMCGAPAAVVRLDAAVMTTDGRAPACPDTGKECGHAAVALIVSPVQYEAALQLSRDAATACGARRPVFLAHQAELAYKWAEYVARSRREKLLLPQQ